MESFEMKKKKKKKMMTKQNLRSREKLSLGEYIVLYPGTKTPAICSGCFSGKLKLRHIFGTAGTHRRLNPGT